MPRKLPVVEQGSSRAEAAGLSQNSLAQMYEEIQHLYASDSRPWVIGYSGGKDSTCALQLIWTALSSLEPENRKKPIYVLSSDTRVETPVIVKYIDTTI